MSAPELLHHTWIHSDRFVPRRFVRPVMSFMRMEAASGVVMLLAAVAAVIWANTGTGDSYFHFLETEFAVEFGAFHLDLHLGHLINDGLMAIFFFVVGLEIKREIVSGELRDPRVAALPILAAVGGMVGPALIYLAFNAGNPAATPGWGVPMATDIAFSVGVLSLLGKRVPTGAKLFLLTLAIADDLGGILVIALFYTSDLAFGWLGMAAVGLAAVAFASRVGIRSQAFYLPVAVVIWYFMLESGVHATVAGVALGFLTPARPMYGAKELDRKARAILDTYPAAASTPEEREHSEHEALQLAEISRESVSPLVRAEHRLGGWTAFLIIPVFALANAGVRFEGSVLSALTSRPALGVALGLVFGKMIGITVFSLAGLKLKLGRLPAGVTRRHLVGVAATAGIGFTVALFITALAYTDAGVADQAKVGIFAGSLVAGVIGTLILATTKKAAEVAEDEPIDELVAA